MNYKKFIIFLEDWIFEKNLYHYKTAKIDMPHSETYGVIVSDNLYQKSVSLIH